MSTKLSKIFRKQNVERFNDSEIEIEVDFDNSDSSIDNVRVTAYNYHDRKLVDITAVFECFPEFINIIDGIDWSEEYSDYLCEQQRNKEALLSYEY